MTKKATAIYVLTQQGALTAKKIAAVMDIDLYVPPSLSEIPNATPFDSLRALVAQTFGEYRQHIFIAAAGVAVRCIAPLLKDKSIDPAIVSLDHHGRNIISLLSGHLGGANKLAHDVAEILEGQAIITTATDTENLPSFDILALEFNMAIANIRAVTKVNAALIAGTPVVVNDPQNLLQLKNSAWCGLFIFTETTAFNSLSDDDAANLPRVTVTPSFADPSDTHLVLRPKVLHVGIGCRRGAKAEEILDLLATAMDQLELAGICIASIATVDIKQHEAGILDAAAKLKVPLRFYNAKELDAVPVTNPSPKVQEILGIDGVCEAAALLAAGKNAKLHLEKLARRNITIAIAEEITTNA